MRKRRWILVTMAASFPFIAAGLVLAANRQETAPIPVSVSPDVIKWGFMAAALVAGLAAVGAAYAVAVVGAAAMGAVAEKPDTAGRALIFVGLAEGIAIYGLIIAIMILGRLPS
ncbi:MAG TPA: ATP synthase subunit C [Thermoanaerobaculia bacterium]